MGLLPEPECQDRPADELPEDGIIGMNSESMAGTIAGISGDVSLRCIPWCHREPGAVRVRPKFQRGQLISQGELNITFAFPGKGKIWRFSPRGHFPIGNRLLRGSNPIGSIPQDPPQFPGVCCEIRYAGQG